MDTGGDFPEVKRQERETDHSLPFSVEVKNGGAIALLPRTSSWHGAKLIKHRDKFTFYFTVIGLLAYSDFKKTHRLI
jgi:hypothetical protein